MVMSAAQIAEPSVSMILLVVFQRQIGRPPFLVIQRSLEVLHYLFHTLCSNDDVKC